MKRNPFGPGEITCDRCRSVVQHDNILDIDKLGQTYCAGVRHAWYCNACEKEALEAYYAERSAKSKFKRFFGDLIKKVFGCK